MTQFLTGDDLASDHLPIEISIDAQPDRNIHTDPIRYKCNQTDRSIRINSRGGTELGGVPELKSS